METLCYAVRCRVLFKYFGMPGAVLVALNSVPLAVAALLGELAVAGRYVVVLVFVLCSRVMSYPLGAAGDSWLEAVSGTTTGLSTTASVEDKPHTDRFWSTLSVCAFATRGPSRAARNRCNSPSPAHLA
ncbi:MAG TPA: hypothetical protein VN283_01940 [Thiobacillus sp.]|nr:hypothetical protein [Thiobacillus sp.]